jgi:phosphoribosylanthranilate isomerase
MERQKSPKIKICGIRLQEDADILNEALPDYAGFIFWEKSFRYVNLETALSLRRALRPQIVTAGVFVDAEPELMLEAAKSGAVSVLQLHGHETDADIAALKRLLLKEGAGATAVWKAFRIRSAEDVSAALRSPADLVLLDNGYGTGEQFDHSLIGEFPRDYFLAGGLTPENLPGVLDTLRPAGADLSSGVETERVKDREKVLRAVAAVRARGGSYTERNR